MNQIHHILVATDFGPASPRALEAAGALAKRFEAKLTVLHVMYASPHVTSSWLQFRDDVGLRLRNLLASTGLEASVAVRYGSPPDEIVEGANVLSADLVVIGSHEHRGILDAFRGSVAERVVRSSPVPVLTVHALATRPSLVAGRRTALVPNGRDT